MAEVGNELARGLPSLQRVLNAYAQLGFADDGARVRQCARDFAADNLGGVDALADVGRLYSPAVPASGDALYALGSVPVAKDFLVRQVAELVVVVSIPSISLGQQGVDFLLESLDFRPHAIVTHRLVSRRIRLDFCAVQRKSSHL